MLRANNFVRKCTLTKGVLVEICSDAGNQLDTFDVLAPATRKREPTRYSRRGRMDGDRSVPYTAIGLGLLLASLIWCLAYYSAWDDKFFGSLDLKLFCVDGATQECRLAARDIIARSGSRVPTYYPILWWAGLGSIAIGFIQRWRSRR
jgi:hypothetical protein